MSAHRVAIEGYAAEFEYWPELMSAAALLFKQERMGVDETTSEDLIAAVCLCYYEEIEKGDVRGSFLRITERCAMLLGRPLTREEERYVDSLLREE